MENENPIEPMNDDGATMKQWLQDNLRIIVSILIVVAIAAGIYSYSKRADVSDQSATPSAEEQLSEENLAKKETSADATDTRKPSSPIIESQETETSFIETAVKGDGTTHLARRALANYLEKNSDSALTAEHKIYIEDFLRKNIPEKRVALGASVEFSKDLIQNAITKSKNLNEKQLQNLHKYAVRVPSLS